MWILRTVNEDLPSQTFRILPGGIKTLGRATGADFILDAALVSRVHCRVTIAPSGDLEVKDLETFEHAVVNAGGSIAAPRHAIAGVGWLTYVRDTEGNIFGMSQPDATAA